MITGLFLNEELPPKWDQEEGGLFTRLYTKFKQTTLVRWRMFGLPNAENIVWSYAAEVDVEERGKGLGQQEHVARIKEAKENMLATYMLCTVALDNKVQKHILKKNGWVFLAHIPGDDVSFTGSILFGKDLTQCS